MKKRLFILDIDDTQIPDRHSGHAIDGEIESIKALKQKLTDLMDQGHIVVHATNAIFSDYAMVRERLATPTYLSCTASTLLLKRDPQTQDWEDVADYESHNRSLGYDAALARSFADLKLPVTALTGEHETPLKVSYKFDDALSDEVRQDAYKQALTLCADTPGMRVEFVDAGDNFYLDFLPAQCSKGDVALFIARREGIDEENIIAFGNGSNDISMFRQGFRGAAVGNASASLVKHVNDMAAGGASQIVTKAPRSFGVLEGLKHFGI